MKWFGYALKGDRDSVRPWWRRVEPYRFRRQDERWVKRACGSWTTDNEDRHTLNALAMAHVDTTYPLPKPTLLAGQIWVDFDRRDHAVLCSFVIAEARPSLVVAMGETIRIQDFFEDHENKRMGRALVYCPGGQAPWTRTDLWRDLE